MVFALSRERKMKKQYSSCSFEIDMKDATRANVDLPFILFTENHNSQVFALHRCTRLRASWSERTCPHVLRYMFEG